jgi:hypothetical protein
VRSDGKGAGGASGREAELGGNSAAQGTSESADFFDGNTKGENQPDDETKKQPKGTDTFGEKKGDQKPDDKTKEQPTGTEFYTEKPTGVKACGGEYAADEPKGNDATEEANLYEGTDGKSGTNKGEYLPEDTNDQGEYITEANGDGGDGSAKQPTHHNADHNPGTKGDEQPDECGSYVFVCGGGRGEESDAVGIETVRATVGSDGSTEEPTDQNADFDGGGGKGGVTAEFQGQAFCGPSSDEERPRRTLAAKPARAS